MAKNTTPRLSILNPHPVIHSGPQLLHDLVQHDSDSTTAVDFSQADGGRVKLSYASLQSQSSSLASKILELLPGGDSLETSQNIIPILLPQSAELYVALLAILKARGAFCPLPLDAPRERLEFILADVSATVVITSSEHRDKIPRRDGLSICVVDAVHEPSNPPRELALSALPPPHLAYVMYTSGSTGTPKAVLVSHSAATQSLLAHDALIPQFFRFLQFAAPTFDVSIFEIFFTLFRGSTLVSCDRRTLLDDLPGAINRLDVDAAELTPTVAGGLLHKRAHVPNLKLLLTIGEMLTAHVVQEFGASETDAGILYGMYGPTEAAIHCTAQPAFSAKSGVGAIGQPFDTVSALILRPVSGTTNTTEIGILPFGEAGELALGGHQLADGYLNRPEQTNNAFIDTAYGRLYRTGDKARILPDGAIECLGRIESGQVKLRGQRLELGEVEQVAMKSQGCRMAVASIINGVLVVFCLGDSGSISKDDVMQQCRHWLPSSFVPADVVLLQELPTLASGKIDKAKLKTDYMATKSETNAAEDDVQGVDAIFCQIAERILHHSITPSTNLASSGLDSLSAIRFATEARNEDINVSALDVLKVENVQDLRKLIENRPSTHRSGPSSAASKLEKVQQSLCALPSLQVHLDQIKYLLPCTPLQSAMLSETSANPQAYCNWVELEVKPATTFEQIKRSLKTIFGRHDILQSGFTTVAAENHTWVQMVWKDHEIDISETDAFDYRFSLPDQASFLRPLQIAVCLTGRAPRILLSLHHALYDGWSIDVLLQDLKDTLENKKPTTPPQFREVAAFQNSIFDSAENSDAREYWAEVLKDYAPSPFPNLSGLKVSASNPCTDSFKMPISAQKLKSLSHCRQVHPQSVLQAAVFYLISSYVGTSDVALGSVNSGRSIPITGIEDIIGPCISTLPLRLAVDGSLSCKELIQKAHAASRESLSHGMLGLRDIKATCGVKPGQPLFDVLCVWQETLRGLDESSDCPRVVDSTDYLEFKLVLEFEPLVDGINLKARYQDNHLPPAQIRSFLNQIYEVVKCLMNSPDMLLDDIAEALPEEVLSIENKTPQHLPAKKTLAGYVESHAVSTPDAPAIQIGATVNGSLSVVDAVTYSELNERANKLASFILSKTPERQSLIGVIMNKSLDLYISILACLKAGSGYVPVSTDTPKGRIGTILEDTGINVCLTQSTLPVHYRELPGVMVYEVDKLSLSEYNASNPAPNVDGLSPAYAMFTSGSTGKPKGLLVTQDNLTSNIETLTSMYPSGSQSKILQACSQAFDVSAFEIFFAWNTGSCLCAATNDALFRDLEDAIRQFDITHLSLTPTVAALVDPHKAPSVEFLVTAGEGLTENVRRKWQSRALFNGYGPAETTNICSVKPMTNPKQWLNNVGPPFPNTSVFVIRDDSLDFTMVPRGGVGELCFGGDQVFHGYLNRPEMNSSKILQHPRYGRLYRSGDVGRLLHDGSIAVLGRTDDQVKIRGQRIELGEIISILMQSTHVSRCTAVVVNRAGLQQIVVFWVPTNDSNEEGVHALRSGDVIKKNESLYNDLKHSLPAYMLPAVLIPVNRMPITPQGKVHKALLTSTYDRLEARILQKFSDASQNPDIDKPLSNMEQEVVTALSKVLRLPPREIKAGTSFFSLGLDSINAISFARMLRGTTRTEVAISEILCNPSVSRLVAKITAREGENRGKPALVKKSLEDLLSEKTKFDIYELYNSRSKRVQKIRPCTPLQEATLSASVFDDKTSYYNHVLLSLAVSIEDMRSAWVEMINRHEILRTCFVTTNDPQYSFVQVVLSALKLPWAVVQVERTAIKDAILNYVNASAPQMNDYRPPYTLKAFSSDKARYLVISMHHALYDGEAMFQLFSEIQQTILGRHLEPSMSPDLFLERALQPSVENADAYWEALLQGFQPVPSMLSSSRVPLANGDSDQQRSFRVKARTLEVKISEVEKAAKRYAVTILSLLQAAWAKFLFGMLDSTDVCFGNVVSGRALPLEHIESLVFPCFNTLPVRSRVSSSASNKDLLEMLHHQNINSLEYQFTPLRRIQTRWRRGNESIFETLFILQKPRKNLDSSIWTLETEFGNMGFPVAIELVPDQTTDSLDANFHYLSDQFSSDEVESILNLFETCVDSCVKRPREAAAPTRNQNGVAIVSNVRQRRPKMEASPAISPKAPRSVTASTDIDSVASLIKELISKFSGVSGDRISPTTTIFELGLDSINAIQIAKLLREKELKVSGADIMENPTIESLVTAIQLRSAHPEAPCWSFDFTRFDKQHRHSIRKQNDIPEAHIQFIRPCTSVQSGMIAQFIHSDGGNYFNHIQWRCAADFDCARLLQAWKTAAVNHEMLRTGFASVDDAKHPFAMVTYHADNAMVQFVDLNEGMNTEDDGLKQLVDAGSESSAQLLTSLRQNLSKAVLDNLSKPSWWLAKHCTRNETWFQLSIHHALYDAQTLFLFMESVKLAYQSRDAPKPSPIAPFVSSILESSYHAESHRAFWEQSLKDAPSTKFPCLTPLQVDSGEPNTMSRELRFTSSDLHSSCRKLGVTFQVILQAAWASILSAYTGADVVTFGVVLSGRSSNAESEDVAFPSSSTVPLTCDTTESKKDLLKRLMDYNKSLLKHQHTQISDIQRWTDHTEHGVFDTIFVYQSLDHKSLDTEYWKVVDETATVEYPVCMEIETAKDDGVVMRLIFRSSILPRAQAEILLQQYEAVIADFAEISDQVVPASSFAEDRLLSKIKPLCASIPSKISALHEFVEQSALDHPDKIALEWVNGFENKEKCASWTYKELNCEGDKVATTIKQHGIEPKSLIAICFDKCPEASFATLGILKAGCAFVALDHTAPIDRQSFIVRDSQAQLLFSIGKFAADLRDKLQIPVIDMGDLSQIIQTADLKSLRALVDPQDTCYCLYTSGSTGTPKGCLISHENAVQAMLSFQRLFAGHWSTDSRWLQFASLHFDVSILEQFWSWSVGICVVSAPRDLIFEDLAGALRGLQITHIDLTPSLARLITPDDVPLLCNGVFITGGEQLKQEILDDWGAKAVIYNGYGPTECTIGVTMYPRVPSNGKPSNIGWQFDNVGTYVLKPNSTTIVLRGAVGELCISGKLVGKGYLKRPELTQERFPFVKEFGERIYRTGDLVRLLHDDSFEFLGRIDDQVKLRGQRLEIGEIAHVLLSMKLVFDATVAVMKHPEKKTDLIVAFVVPKQADTYRKEQSFIDDINQGLSAKLPRYMVPSQIILLAAIPLTVNNKADMKRLREMFVTQVSKSKAMNGYSQNKNISQELPEDVRKIATVLAIFLSVPTEELDGESNLFQAGLDSVSVFAFARTLRQQGYRNAQPSSIMQSRTVADLAKTLETETDEYDSDKSSIIAAKQNIAACKHRYRALAAEYLGIKTNDIEELAPCTPLQQGMIARSMSHDRALYFNAMVFELPPTVDLVRVKAAWQHVFDIVKILRTQFVPVDDGYIQVAVRGRSLPLIEIKSSTGVKHTKDNLDQWHREWYAKNAESLNRPFELVLDRLGDKALLIVHIFHALYDATSILQIFDAVEQCYNGNSSIIDDPSFYSILPYGPLREVGGARDFWCNYMRKAPLHLLSTRTGTRSETGTGSAKLTIPSLSKFENTRRRLNVTHQAVIQACWMVVLQNFAMASLTVGIVVSGRSFNCDGIENVIGPLFNTLPFYLRFASQDLWQSLIKSCHDFNVSAVPYQHTSLHNIAKWCNKSTQPLFDTLFVFQKGFSDSSSGSVMFSSPLQEPSVADYALSFEASHQYDGSLELTLVTWESIADDETCAQLLLHFKSLLESVLETPDSTVQSFMGPEFGSKSDSQKTTQGQLMPPSTPDSDRNATPIETSIIDEIVGLMDAESAVRASTSVFEAGLDSIDAIKLSSRLKKRDIVLGVSTIMQNPVISSMAAKAKLLSSREHQTSSTSSFTILKARLKEYLSKHAEYDKTIERVLPATPLQEAIIAKMRSTDYNTYFNHDVFQIPANIDFARLINAWETVISASPILRTGFVEIEDVDFGCTFAQVVHQAPSDMVKKTSRLSELPLDDLLEEIRQEMMISDKSRSPLRLTFDDDGRYMVLSISHALYDGWSLGLLHNDVNDAYHDRYVSRTSYESHLANIISASDQDAETFWRSALEDAQPCKFPARRETRSTKSDVVHRRQAASKLPLQEIEKFCRNQNITLQALVQTCWTFVLASYTQKLDIVSGVVLSGRDTEDAQEILFPTMNTIALRSIIHGSRSDMLRYMQSNLISGMQYQHFALRRSQAMAASAGEDLFNALFIFQKHPMEPQLRSTLYKSIHQSSSVEYPVCVEAEAVDGELLWRTACSDEMLSEEGTRRLLRELDNVLQSIIEFPDTPSIVMRKNKIRVCDLAEFEIHENTPAHDSTLLNGDHVSMVESADWSPIEKILREILSAVSKVPESEISKSQTIYHLGLDSISAIKVSGILRKKGLRLTVSDMVRSRTIKDMALLLQENGYLSHSKWLDTEGVLKISIAQINVNKAVEKSGVNSMAIESILPATAGQTYFLATWQNSNGALFYPTFTYKLTGVAAVSQIRQAWKILVEQEPILRTTFVATGNTELPVIQLILRHAENSFVDDISILKQSVPRFSRPPVHLCLRPSTGAIIVQLRIQHALYDAVSLQYLIRRLKILSIDASSPPVPMNAKFYEFVAAALTPTSQTKRKEFWTAYLEGFDIAPQKSTLHIPFYPRTTFYSPEAVAPIGSLIALARSKGVTFQAIVLATIAPLLPCTTRIDESIVIGVYLANRAQAPDLTSPTVNIVPLRIKNQHSQDILALARNIQNDLQEISTPQNAAVALWEIKQWTGVRIECIVNFLALPDDDMQELNEGIKALSDDQNARAEVEEAPVHEAQVDEPLDVELAQSYSPTIDIELAVRNGALDVGVFGPAAMLDLPGARDLVERLRVKLLELE